MIDREVFKPVLTGVAMIKAAFELYPGEFEWKEPPYEYVYDRNPFDVIHGSTKLRELFERTGTVSEVAESWRADESEFAERRLRYLIY